MKHIAIDFHFIRDKVQNGELCVFHVLSFDQLTNVFTELLSHQQFLLFRSKIGVFDGSTILQQHIGKILLRKVNYDKIIMILLIF